MTHFPDPAPGSHRRWAIFVVGAINFIMSMFYRVSLAVISPSLISDLRFDASQLSDLSAAFFYGFALCQLPLGLAIDRIGARKGLILLGAPAIAGGFVFALGQSYEHLLLGRFLLGIGMGGNLMLVLALLAVWFPLDRFASLGSSLVAIGVVGNLFAATPLALMNGWLGWRSCFIIFTIVNALIIISFILIIRNYPPGYVKRAVKNRNLLQGFKTIARMYGYWAISLGNFVRYGYFVAIQGLWATPFLIYGVGMSQIAAADTLLFLGFGYMIGLPLFGFLSDRIFRSRKKVVVTTFSLSVALTLSIFFWSDHVDSLIIKATFFAMGLLAAPGQISYAHIKELVPSSITAQAMTAVNLFTILGAALMTQVLGLFVQGDMNQLSGVKDFRFIWFAGAALLAIVTVMYSFVPESPVFGRSATKQ